MKRVFKRLLDYLKYLERKKLNPKRQSKAIAYREHRQLRRPICSGPIPQLKRKFSESANGRNIIF